MDQDEYIKTLRPIISAELTGAPAEALASKDVANRFVSLRGAIAYCVLTQAWIMVYVVALQRIQEPTNLDVRRLNAITRKLQKEPKKLTYPGMRCKKKVDVHADSGYRRLSGGPEDVEKGYGMRGLNVMRRGSSIKTGEEVIHLIESICKSHRLQVRSSYGGEMLANARGMEDAYPALITLHELHNGRGTAMAAFSCSLLHRSFQSSRISNEQRRHSTCP